jgi:hypothetical protein
MDALRAVSQSNVINLSEYRAVREMYRLRPAPSYVLWYPGVGYVTRNVAQTGRAPGTRNQDLRR